MFKLSGKSFFDAKGMVKEIERSNRRFLFRAAAKTRAEIARQLKRRKATAPPGQSPHTHSPGGLKRVAFNVDIPNQMARVGSVELGGATGVRSAPLVQEFGGIVNRPPQFRKRRGRRRNNRGRSRKGQATAQRNAGGSRRSFRVQPHPYHKPGFEIAQRVFLDIYVSSFSWRR